MVADQIDLDNISPRDRSRSRLVERSISRSGHGAAALIRRIVALAVGLILTIIHMVRGLLGTVVRSGGALIALVVSLGGRIMRQTVGILRRVTA
jgi:hypothetical protein